MRDVSRREFLVDSGATVFGAGALASADDDEEEETPIDVFLAAGQSNAEGRGDVAESPDPPRGVAYEYSGSGIEFLDDPVGGSFEGTEPAKTGSAWPAFAEEWSEYDRRCVIVPVARGNTAQVADADAGDGNWDLSGRLRYTARDATNKAVTWLRDEGYDPTLGGGLWLQGERDAAAIDDDVISRDDYEDGLEEMIEFYREEIREELQFYINQTGMPDDGDTDGFEEVREAQEEVASDDAETYLATDVAKQFPSEGMMSDRLHYTQEGYDLLGRRSAEAVYDSEF